MSVHFVRTLPVLIAGEIEQLDLLTDLPISTLVPEGSVRYVIATQLVYVNTATGWEPLGSGGGGAVDSVNGQTGVVVLDTDDIAEGSINLYFTDARVALAVAGTPNTLAFHDSTGNLISSNYWLLQDDGRMSGGTTFFADNLEAFRINADVQVANSYNNLSLYAGTLSNAGTMTGFISLMNIAFNDIAGTTDFLNGLNIGTQGNTVGDKQMATFYSNGIVGGGLLGIFLNSDDDVVGNVNMLSITSSGTIGGTYNGPTIFLPMGSSIGGNAYFYNLGVDGTVAQSATVLNANIAGAIAADFNASSVNVTGNVGSGTHNLNGYQLIVQNTSTVAGNITGFILNTAGTVTGTNSVTGGNINNQGTAYRFTGYAAFNSANLTEEIRGFQFNTTGDSRTSTGLDIVMNGNATDDAQGIRVNVNNQTSTNARVRSIDAQGGTYSFDSRYVPASSLFVDTGNNLFTQLRVPSGSPLSGTEVLTNNNVIAFLIEDDVAPGPIGLGLVHTTSISLLGVATGKTVTPPMVGMAVAGSVQNPGFADAGTVTDFRAFDYIGILPGGGNTAVTTAIGLNMRTGFDGYATNNWGLRVQGTTAHNYVNRLAVGTPSETAGTGLAHDVYGQVGVTAIGFGFSIAEGSNAKMGTVALVAGFATVSTTAVTANSRIFLTNQAASLLIGVPHIDNIIPGTSFDIVTTEPTETSTYAWMIVEAL